MTERKTITRRNGGTRSKAHEDWEKTRVLERTFDEDSVTAAHLIAIARAGEKLGSGESEEHQIGGHDTTDNPRK